VHIVPHTHDDVGWVRTVDEYFSGSQPNVAIILDSVVSELQRDLKRTFTFVEMKFFSMWYNFQNEETKKIVK
jgi:hypothetical protein